jgi:hypothetical protein
MFNLWIGESHSSSLYEVLQIKLLRANAPNLQLGYTIFCLAVVLEIVVQLLM